MKIIKFIGFIIFIAIIFTIAGLTIPVVKEFVKEGVGKTLFQLCYGTVIVFCFYFLFFFVREKTPF